MNRRNAFIAVITATVAVIMAIGGGAAYGYLTAHGNGSGTATIANGDSNVTIATAATTGVTALYPGGSGDLIVTATNPNNSDVQITGFTIASVTGCTTPDLSVNAFSPVPIPHNTTAGPITITGALKMAADATNDCQGKTLTVNLSSVTVQQ